jgi:predicted DNA-binding protein
MEKGGLMSRGKKEERVEERGVKQLALRLPEDLHKNLKIKCVKEGRTMAEVLVELIEEYLKRKG